jgi:polyisoprenoid-binding protein YceI
MIRRPWLLVVPAALLAGGAVLLAADRPALSAPEAGNYEGDTVHSHVLYRAKHLGTSWSYGRFDDFTVSFTATEGGASLTAVRFAVKAESVNSGNPKRDTHLKSQDFLNAKQFPEIKFESKSAKALDADTTEVTGDLTLHGVTKPLTVKVTKVGTGKGREGEELLGYETTFTVKRSEFEITYGLQGVSDEITMTVAVEGTKK